MFENPKRSRAVTIGLTVKSHDGSQRAIAGNPTPGDWTQQELCELDRIRSECTPRSSFELQCSHTDEDDPWCIVWDRERELVVFHIAGLTADT